MVKSEKRYFADILQQFHAQQRTGIGLVWFTT